ncbi:MAG TPA: biopolymer transporter ExbD [Candidatus Aminicenantes bacterium]|nr:biopolymer transporter ExbD [Candidatus Aminicenantes bacterium]
MALSAGPLSSAGSRRRAAGTHLSEINVTPLVDVMLVLLVIFMVTAPMMQSGIGIDLPQAETDTKPAEEGLTLTVTKDQYVHIGDATININLLERRLVEYFANRPKKVLYLQADASLPYGVVVRIMDITKKAGVEVLGIITEPVDVVKDKRK